MCDVAPELSLTDNTNRQARQLKPTTIGWPSDWRSIRQSELYNARHFGVLCAELYIEALQVLSMVSTSQQAVMNCQLYLASTAVGSLVNSRTPSGNLKFSPA